jgi:four helix bundle suffix protein
MKDKPGFIPAHGNYRELLSYRKAEIVYDLTYRFCERFLARLDRTVDQMVQAARSGKQNIMEGSKVSGTSKEMEIKLLGVARAGLEELLGDYCDFLLDRQIRRLERDFVREGGLRERMTRARLATAERGEAIGHIGHLNL